MSVHKVVWGMCVVVFALSFWSCGSNRSSDGFQETPFDERFGTDAEGRIFVGSGTCINCHQGLSFSAPGVNNYLQSAHVGHSTAINAASSEFCLGCHDPIRDGRTLEPFIDPERVPEQGLAAVGCENCHGAGGGHFGIGPIPNFNPDFTVCGQCHTALPPGPLGHRTAFADNILENYQSSAHAASSEGKRITGTQDMSALCARCHSDEGFQQFRHVVGGTGQLTTGLASVVPLRTVSPVQCRTCHDPHATQLRTVDTFRNVGTFAAPDNRIVFSAQFTLCTSCHQAFLTANFDADSGTFHYELDQAIYGMGAGAPDPTQLQFHHPASGSAAPSIDRIITDTHFSAVDDGSGNPVAGYNINAADAHACTLCHDPHGATKFDPQAEAQAIAEQWAVSGHATYQGAPFTTTFGPGREVCMKCHSGTEYVRFIHGVPDDQLQAGEQRVIACVSCHDLSARDAGGNFDLGPLRLVEEVPFPSGAVRSLDGGSNLCMVCHQGRASGLTVAERIAAGNLAFVNIHDYAAAATFFGSEVQSGFEYPGRSYRGMNTFPGHLANLGPGQLTVCSSCHLDRGNADHTFIPPLTTCSTGAAACHSGVEFTDLSGSPVVNKTQIDAMKDQLLALLIAGGVERIDGFPYFRNITTPNQLQGAYNWQVADKDPCGYIHNGIYMRQLLFDSIEDLGGVPAFPRP
jgi:hypothetical protein